MLACNTPVAVADVGAMRDLFADTPQLLFRADDAQALADAVIGQLDRPRRPQFPIMGWAQLVTGMERELLALVQPTHTEARSNR
jgi:glycosyltransferase involved in cell wall biosynthesis